MNTTSMFGPVRGLLVVLAAAACGVSSISGQELARGRFGAAVRSPIDIEPGSPADMEDSAFTRNTFFKPWNPVAARRRLEGLLRQRIDGVDHFCHLTVPQRKKLELTGQGDLHRLFECVDEFRKEYEAAQSGVFVKERWERWAPVEARLASGPFGEDSLFAKSLAGLLAGEQKSAYDRLLSQAGTKRISVENATAMLRIGELQSYLYRMIWSRDAKQAAFVTASFNQPIEIRALPDYRLVRTIGADKKPVGFDFSRDETLVALTDNSTNAFLIDIPTGKEIALPTGNSQPAVQFSPDGTMVVTGGYGELAKLWSSKGQFVREFDTGRAKGCLTPVFSPDGRILAVGNRNSTTCLFDVATGRRLHELNKRSTHGLKFDPTGKMLAVAYVDATLALWDVESGKLLRSIKAQGEELYTVDWSPDGTLLVTAGYGAPVTLWNPSDLSLLNELESPTWVMSAEFSPDGATLVFAGNGREPQTDGRVEVWGVP